MLKIKPRGGSVLKQELIGKSSDKNPDGDPKKESLEPTKLRLRQYQELCDRDQNTINQLDKAALNYKTFSEKDLPGYEAVIREQKLEFGKLKLQRSTLIEKIIIYFLLGIVLGVVFFITKEVLVFSILLVLVGLLLTFLAKNTYLVSFAMKAIDRNLNKMQLAMDGIKNALEEKKGIDKLKKEASASYERIACFATELKKIMKDSPAEVFKVLEEQDEALLQEELLFSEGS